jgi:hypothetical protein
MFCKFTRAKPAFVVPETGKIAVSLHLCCHSGDQSEAVKQVFFVLFPCVMEKSVTF